MPLRQYPGTSRLQSSFQGAWPGRVDQSGSLPQAWRIANTQDLNVEVVEVNTDERGRDYVDVRFSGARSGPNPPEIHFIRIPAKNGDVVRQSHLFGIAAGSGSAVSRVRFGIDAYLGAGTNPVWSLWQTQALNFTRRLPMSLFMADWTINQLADEIASKIYIDFIAGERVDLTVRFGWTHLAVIIPAP